MISYPVGLLVNNVRSEGSELIELLKSPHYCDEGFNQRKSRTGD